MTRADTMLKLLAVGECRLMDLFEVTGWPFDEVRAVLRELLDAGKVSFINSAREKWYRVASSKEVA